MRGKAIVLSGGFLDTKSAKTTHGLLRGSERFDVLAVVDEVFAGRDAGEVMDGNALSIPVYKTIHEALHVHSEVDFCIVGVAPKGGRLPSNMKEDLLFAIQSGISIISGLHQFLSEDPDLSAAASISLASIYDIRKPRSREELHFWSGAVYEIKCPKIAVMGTDCGLGKRTTAKLLVEALRKAGKKAEMIYTGQTGWMQGWKYGFILDATYNDFVSGELEYMMHQCWIHEQPDFIIVEGQSALRNPSGPCGAEFLLSGGLDAVILHHAPGRKYFDGLEHLGLEIPPVASEVELIQKYGVQVLAMTLNTKNLSHEEKQMHAQTLSGELQIPVYLPLEEGMDKAAQTIIDKFISHEN